MSEAMFEIELPDFENETETAFEILDDKMAEWAIRKIKEARNDSEKWENHFMQQMAQIRKRNQQTEDFFTNCLRRYFETVPLKETKTQAKYVLPSGEMVRKKQAPEYIRDDEKLTAFLQSNGMNVYLETKTYPKWAELKRNCIRLSDGTLAEADTGLAVEGVTVQERPDKFEVK